MYERQSSFVRKILKKPRGAISRITDAWSSFVYKRNMVVTGNWPGHNWNLYSTTLASYRSPTPHTSDAVCSILKETIEDWELAGSLQSMTIDSYCDSLLGNRTRHI